MPVSVVYENDGLGVVMTAFGVMQENDFADANAQLYVPEVMAKLKYEIVDIRDVENVDTNLEKLKDLAQTDKDASDLIPGLKIAIVASSGVLEALAQVYERMAKCDTLKTKVFRTLPEARLWIADCVVVEESA